MLIIFGLAIAGLNDITRLGQVSLSEIVCVLAVLLLAYCRGMALGACAGAAAGIVCAMNSADMLPVIGIYTLCGFWPDVQSHLVNMAFRLRLRCQRKSRFYDNNVYLRTGQYPKLHHRGGTISACAEKQARTRTGVCKRVLYVALRAALYGAYAGGHTLSPRRFVRHVYLFGIFF